jgi:signal recognition particle subunit SEC65
VRAKLVENIKFERGIDPKDSMEIGRLGKRAMDKMISGVLYLSKIPRWDYYWWFKDPKNNKIYRAFSLKRDGGYKVSEWGYHCDEEEKDFPLDLIPTKKHFDKFYAKINGIDHFNESQNFERGIDPKDSIRIGRKHIWNMTAEELANHILDTVSDKVRPILNKIEDAVKKAGYKDIETYQEYVYLRFDEDDKFPFVSKEIDDAEQELEETIASEVENFPIRDEKAKKNLIGDLFTLELEGGPHKTYVEMIKQKLDPAYIKESVNFERGIDPKDSIRVGRKWKWDMTAEELAIHIIDDIEEKTKPIIKKITIAVKKVGFRSLSEYNSYILDQYDNAKSDTFQKFKHETKEIEDAEKELEDTITEEIKKYPFKEGINSTRSVIGNLFTLILEGGAFMTYVDIIKGYLDKIYLKESINFERGLDPKDSIDIGSYRTDAPKINLFKKMHQLAKMCPIFKDVSEIDWDKPEPKFIIFSTKTHKKTPTFKETYTLYFTNVEELGIILFDDIEDSEYENISLDEFKKITSCK